MVISSSRAVNHNGWRWLWEGFPWRHNTVAPTQQHCISIFFCCRGRRRSWADLLFRTRTAVSNGRHGQLFRRDVAVSSSHLAALRPECIEDACDRVWSRAAIANSK